MTDVLAMTTTPNILLASITAANLIASATTAAIFLALAALAARLYRAATATVTDSLHRYRLIRLLVLTVFAGTALVTGHHLGSFVIEWHSLFIGHVEGSPDLARLSDIGDVDVPDG